MSELALLQWIQSRLENRSDDILVDSGDDAAVVRVGKRSVLLKTDAIIDGVHFHLSQTTPEKIGHKAIARSLSDMGAMGGQGTFAVVAMAIPRRMSRDKIEGVFRGMKKTARRFGVSIVGGDIASHSGKLGITVSLMGELPGGNPVLRSGAKVGDQILVTGALGGSIEGKHLRFVPRVQEGLYLAREYRIHSMIDISDGLVTDLTHICEASGVGANLDSKKIPISAAAKRMKGPALHHALYDGEDYELLFTTKSSIGSRITAQKRGRIIGEVISKRSIFLDGKPLARGGWEHTWK